MTAIEIPSAGHVMQSRLSCPIQSGPKRKDVTVRYGDSAGTTLLVRHRLTNNAAGWIHDICFLNLQQVVLWRHLEVNFSLRKDACFPSFPDPSPASSGLRSAIYTCPIFSAGSGCEKYWRRVSLFSMPMRAKATFANRTFASIIDLPIVHVLVGSSTRA